MYDFFRKHNNMLLFCDFAQITTKKYIDRLVGPSIYAAVLKHLYLDKFQITKTKNKQSRTSKDDQ